MTRPRDPNAPDPYIGPPAPPTLFKVGDILRYGVGATALMRVTDVSLNHGTAGITRYYGLQFYGGSCGAYHESCQKAVPEDVARYEKQNPPRPRNTGSPRGEVPMKVAISDDASDLFTVTLTKAWTPSPAPQIPYWRCVMTSRLNDGTWPETFGSEGELRVFLKGLKTAFDMVGAKFTIPEIP